MHGRVRPFICVRKTCLGAEKCQVICLSLEKFPSAVNVQGHHLGFINMSWNSKVQGHHLGFINMSWNSKVQGHHLGFINMSWNSKVQGHH